MALRKDNYSYNTYGNTVLQPDITVKTKEQIRREKEERERRKRERQAQIKQSNKKKIRVMSIIGVATFLFSFSLFRSSTLFSYQKEYNDLKTETRALNQEIEGYKAQIIKGSSIGELTEKASEIGMVSMSDENTLYIDFSKNHFTP